MTVTTTKLILDGDPNGLVAAMSRARGAVKGGSDEMEGSFRQINTSVAALGVSMGTLTLAASVAANASMKYLASMETYGLAISSAFMTSGTYTDQLTGKVLKGEEALNAARRDAAKVMEELQFANLQTTATLDQLVKAYQEALPVAMAKGFDRGQVKDFTVAMVQAASAIGLSFEQMGEETRSLLTESINPRTSRIATVLGLRNEDVRQFKGDADGLFAFLMEKLDAYKIAGAAAQHTWDGLWSNAKDIGLKAGGEAFQPVFEAVKHELEGITSSIVTIDEKTKRISWNQSFLNGIADVKSGITATIAEAYRFSMLIDKVGGTMTTIGSVMLKTAEVATRFITIGQFGDTFKSGADSMNAWNREFERRYNNSAKALQDLANREVSGVAEVAAGGAAWKGKPLKADSGDGKKGKKEKINLGVDADGAVQAYRAEQAEIQKIKTEMHWNDVAETNAKNRADEQAEFEHTQTLAGLQNTLSQKRMLARGEESEALDAQFMYEQQQADAQMQWKLDHTYLEEEEISRIKAEHGERRLVAEQELAQRQADLWAQGAQTYLGFAESMTTLGVSMMLSEEQQKGEIGSRMLATSVRFIAQGLQNFMFSKAKEHLLAAASLKGQIAAKATQATSEMAIGATQATAWAAFYAAHSLNPIGAAVYGASAAAMTAAAGGFGAAGAAVIGVGAAGAGATVAGELGMAAAWGAGGVAVGAIGSAGATAIESGNSGNAAGYGGGTSFSPVITQPVGGTQGGGINITVKIEGNVISDDRWVEERLAPAIKDLATNRNVDFGLVTV